MRNRNNLYYIAAAATVVLFIIALVGLSSCDKAEPAGTSNQDPAVLNAYQQGYLDGYSKGYADGWTTGMESNENGTLSSSCTSSSNNCGPSTDADTIDDDIEE